MSTIGHSYLTIADKMKRQDPDNKVAAIIEQLSETNEILMDAVTVEGNLPTGHRTTIRTGMPSATFRQLYGGVQPSKSTTKQVDDACGMLEAYAEIDAALANLNGNSAEFRLSESASFLESMNQTMAKTLFYGNTATEPEKFMGMAPRFNDLSAENKTQIVDGGGTGSVNTSIWIVTWGERTCYTIYPKGSQAGLSHTDKGQVTKENADGSMFEVFRDHFKWDLGFTVRDWRYLCRIANIDTDALASAGTSGYSGPHLVNLLIEGMNRLENLNGGRVVIYCNRTVKAALDKIAASKENVNLNVENFGGKPTTMFWGVPVRRCDAILNTEERVV